MVVSRVLPTLIRCNHLISPIIKVEFCRSRYLVKSFDSVKFVRFNSKKMSIEVSKEILNDPKRHIDYDQFLEKSKDGKTYIIDVRQPGEIEDSGKIPNSINIPLPDVEEALGPMPSGEFKEKYGAEKPMKNADIIFTCNTGKRSVKALKLSLAQGYVNSANYKGGWQEWSAKNKE